VTNAIESIETEIFDELVKQIKYCVSNNNLIEDTAYSVMEVFLNKNLYVDTSGIHEVIGSEWMAYDDSTIFRSIWYADPEEDEDD
jgi:hypothetical protein